MEISLCDLKEIIYKKIYCKYCNSTTTPSFVDIDNHLNFYCYNCQISFKWTYKTQLNRMTMTDEAFLTILVCFLNKFSQKMTKTHMIIESKPINRKTVSYYFNIFQNITYEYYQEKTQYKILKVRWKLTKLIYLK